MIALSNKISIVCKHIGMGRIFAEFFNLSGFDAWEYNNFAKHFRKRRRGQNRANSGGSMPTAECCMHIECHQRDAALLFGVVPSASFAAVAEGIYSRTVPDSRKRAAAFRNPRMKPVSSA